MVTLPNDVVTDQRHDDRVRDSGIFQETDGSVPQRVEA
jgi:hypothetical protein